MTQMHQESLLSAAHDYRRRGWRVIQLHHIGPGGACSCQKAASCTSAGKHPIDARWQNSPALSAPDVEALWEERPLANVGIATGAPSGFWVLDIDPGKGGLESMGALVAEHGRLPETFVAQTGSTGYHYFFTMPDFELRNSADRVAMGIDVRADGGQIVAAPSISGKGVYTVLYDLPLAPAPQWLLDLVKRPEHSALAVTAKDLPKPWDISTAEWERLSAYAMRAIESERQRLTKLAVTGWQGEGWNNTTFEVSCALLEFANSPWNAYSPGQARADVLSHAPRDKSGFDDEIVERIFESAMAKVLDKARAVPIDRKAEPDPLFDGERTRPADPTTPGEGDPRRPAAGSERFFGGDKGSTPLYDEMGRGVFEIGPVGWGRDQDFWSYADGAWHPDHYVVQHRLVDMLGGAYRRSHTTNTQDVVQRHAQPITGDPLEQLMNFKNGMLDWRTGALLDHAPEYGSTVQLGCDWIPDATCPKFDAFLADVMHEDYVALAWEMIGYMMLSGNPRHVAFLFYGSGGNGKSTLMDVIGHLVGMENIASESLDDLNANRFRTASLFGKIANLAGDIDATYQQNTATFKRITGEDEITAEHKNMPPFRFQSWAVPMFSANKFPGSADVTDGYLRRWIVLHFHKRIPQDKMVDRSILIEGFLEELTGIAAKGVAALRALMDRGNFAPYGEATKAKEEFALAIDHVRQWLASGDAILSPNTETPLMELYSSYSIWAQRSGQRPIREFEFSHRLDTLGFPRLDSGIASHVGLIAAPTQYQHHAAFEI